MSAAPISRSVDERIKDAIAEPIAELIKLDVLTAASLYARRRGNMLGAILEEWDRIDPSDVRWNAVEALVFLDAEGFGEGLPALSAMRSTITDLLDALLRVSGQVDDGIEWATMHAAKCAIGALPELYAQLEDEVAAVKS